MRLPVALRYPDEVNLTVTWSFFRITHSSAKKNRKTYASVYLRRKRATLLNFTCADSPRDDILEK